jgi:hypothetical protein
MWWDNDQTKEANNHFGDSEDDFIDNDDGFDC